MDYTGISTIRSIIPKLPLFLHCASSAKFQGSIWQLLCVGGGGGQSAPKVNQREGRSFSSGIEGAGMKVPDESGWGPRKGALTSWEDILSMRHYIPYTGNALQSVWLRPDFMFIVYYINCVYYIHKKKSVTSGWWPIPHSPPPLFLRHGYKFFDSDKWFTHIQLLSLLHYGDPS